MSCSASADLSQDMLRSPLHSSDSYAQLFGSCLPQCSEDQGYLQSLQNGLFLQRLLLNDGAEKTTRHQTAIRSEAATPNAGGDNLNQLKKSNLEKVYSKIMFATSMRLVSSLDSLLVSGTDRSFVIDTLVSTLPLIFTHLKYLAGIHTLQWC